MNVPSLCLSGMAITVIFAACALKTPAGESSNAKQNFGSTFKILAANKNASGSGFNLPTTKGLLACITGENWLKNGVLDSHFFIKHASSEEVAIATWK